MKLLKSILTLMRLLNILMITKKVRPIIHVRYGQFTCSLYGMKISSATELKKLLKIFFVAFFVAFSTKKATNYFNLYNLPFVFPLSMSLSSAINSFNNSFVLVSFNPRLSAISAVLCHSPSFNNFKIFSY